MSGLREKLDALAGEREDLGARLADGEDRLREIEELPGLVEEYLRDLPELMGPKIRVRGYETVPEPRTEDNPLGVPTPIPDRIMHPTNEELVAKRLAAEAAGSAEGSGGSTRGSPPDCGLRGRHPGNHGRDHGHEGTQTMERITETIDLYYWPTPNGWKISIALEELGLPYNIVPVNIATGDQFEPEFLKDCQIY